MFHYCSLILNLIFTWIPFRHKMKSTTYKERIFRTYFEKTFIFAQVKNSSSISRSFIYSIVHIKILNWLYMQWPKANIPDISLHDKIMAARKFFNQWWEKKLEHKGTLFLFWLSFICRGNENGMPRSSLTYCMYPLDVGHMNRCFSMLYLQIS